MWGPDEGQGEGPMQLDIRGPEAWGGPAYDA
jgi:hypothetical protein